MSRSNLSWFWSLSFEGDREVSGGSVCERFRVYLPQCCIQYQHLSQLVVSPSYCIGSNLTDQLHQLSGDVLGGGEQGCQALLTRS